MLLGSILLALAWAALQGEMTLANLLVGYVVGYGILAILARGQVMPSTLVSRTAHALGLAAFFAWELLLANFRVAADVLRGNRIEPAVVAIPLDITSDGEILLLSMLINITPGSVTIDLSGALLGSAGGAITAPSSPAKSIRASMLSVRMSLIGLRRRTTFQQAVRSLSRRRRNRLGAIGRRR